MKKRITCLLLTLIMLVSLVPAASLTASAASLSVSEAAITVLKKMTLFKSECYQVANTQEFRIGYGTVCNEKGHNIGADGKPIADKTTEKHKISQDDADKALRNALKEIDKKVNSFASSNGLSLKQNQHDALVIFSFDSGTAWMDGNGVVKTAIVNGANANELLNAMNEWTKMNDLNRRKVEVNMYMNSVYSNVVPSSYAKVTYNANGGTMAQGNIYEMLFDTTTAVAHIPTPTKSNSTFVGWYLSASGKQPGDAKDLQWVPNLNYLCAGHTLYALWQKNGEDNSNTAGVAVNYTLAKSQLASKTMYNRPNLKASDIKETGKVTADKVTVLQDYIGTDGTRWAKLGDWQWVIVKAGSNGISSGGTDIDVTVTVTNSYVNSRVNATIHSATNGSYKQGAQLRIINTAQADGFLWGQVAKSEDDDTPICWVALMYTNWNSVKDEGTSGNGASTNSKAIAKATITNNGYVNVRSDAGTDNKIVGSLAKNETVEVYEIKTVNGHQWGRTTAGWFCMTYASVTMLTTNSTNNIISDAGALDYAFTGKTTKELMPKVQAGDNTNQTGDTVK
ncbi:MAG: InlB B-repeat-containing protein, partial [Eubacteriales bacterium]|nr:InlB B-repeat-containing protein [Eubacteriales bacterium]